MWSSSMHPFILCQDGAVDRLVTPSLLQMQYV